MTNRRIAAIAIAVLLTWGGAAALALYTAPTEPRVEDPAPGFTCRLEGNEVIFYPTGTNPLPNHKGLAIRCPK